MKLTSYTCLLQMQVRCPQEYFSEGLLHRVFALSLSGRALGLQLARKG